MFHFLRLDSFLLIYSLKRFTLFCMVFQNSTQCFMIYLIDRHVLLTSDICNISNVGVGILFNR